MHLQDSMEHLGLMNGNGQVASDSHVASLWLLLIAHASCTFCHQQNDFHEYAQFNQADVQMRVHQHICLFAGIGTEHGVLVCLMQALQTLLTSI